MSSLAHQYTVKSVLTVICLQWPSVLCSHCFCPSAAHYLLKQSVLNGHLSYTATNFWSPGWSPKTDLTIYIGRHVSKTRANLPGKMFLCFQAQWVEFWHRSLTKAVVHKGVHQNLKSGKKSWITVHHDKFRVIRNPLRNINIHVQWNLRIAALWNEYTLWI
jgi:hypothetical protein